MGCVGVSFGHTRHRYGFTQTRTRDTITGMLGVSIQTLGDTPV